MQDAWYSLTDMHLLPFFASGWPHLVEAIQICSVWDESLKPPPFRRHASQNDRDVAWSARSLWMCGRKLWSWLSQILSEVDPKLFSENSSRYTQQNARQSSCTANQYHLQAAINSLRVYRNWDHCLSILGTIERPVVQNTTWQKLTYFHQLVGSWPSRYCWAMARDCRVLLTEALAKPLLVTHDSFAQ